jgi:TRAP-type C4-dicarboxylate transport system substrate-binding protein
MQRADAAGLNRKLQAELTKRGMVFVDSDIATFRAPLGPYYTRWKNAIGSRATNLLEAAVGKLSA